jgi:hypothetical protein
MKLSNQEIDRCFDYGSKSVQHFIRIAIYTISIGFVFKNNSAAIKLSDSRFMVWLLAIETDFPWLRKG